MKPRHKRFLAIAVGVAALSTAAALVLSALNKNLVFFFTPSQVAANEAPYPCERTGTPALRQRLCDRAHPVSFSVPIARA